MGFEMKPVLLYLGLLLSPALVFAQAPDQVADVQRALQRQTQLDLQAEQTRIMGEQLELQRRQLEQQQRAQDDETLRRHNEALRRQPTQKSELDAELDRQAAAHLQEKQKAETEARVRAATRRGEAYERNTAAASSSRSAADTGSEFAEQQRRSVAASQTAYSFTNEGDALFTQFEAFLNDAEREPKYRRLLNDEPEWPMILATEFAAQRGILRKGIQQPQSQGAVFTAFNLAGGAIGETRVYNGYIAKRGETLMGVPSGYVRTIEVVDGDQTKVTDKKKTD